MDEEAIIALFQGDAKRVYTLPEILKKLDVSSDRVKGAKRTLKGLLRRGVLEREQGRRYRLSRAGAELEGSIELDERGRALFVVPDRRTPRIPVAEEDSCPLEPGDRIVAKIEASGRRGHLRARVLKVLERPRPPQLGIFRRIARMTFVEIEEPARDTRARRRGPSRRPAELLVPTGAASGAEDGDLVEIEAVREGHGPAAKTHAKVLRVLGHPGERETEMRRLLLDHHLELRFPERAEGEARRFGDAPSEADVAGRRDLRDLPLVTIDGETAKDFDDAVCAVRRGTEGYALYVAIADVAHYVRPDTALDEEARRRGTSTYLTDRAIPMLPEALSNHLCSLKPGVDRLCMVTELDIDHAGHVERTQIYPAVMRSHARLTYTTVARALDGNPDEDTKRLLPTLILLYKVAALHLARRLKRGALDLDLAEPVVTFDEQSFPVDVAKMNRTDAHRLIEDLMLAANEAVASFFVERTLPSIFRIHEDPDPDKLQLFAALCTHLGIPVKLRRRPSPRDLAAVLEKLSLHAVGKTLSSFLLRSLMQARYDADCKGHFGLATERYLHFTSPIRRYPDLMVHRLLKRMLAGEPLGYSRETLQAIATSSSEAERRAMLAERESMDLDRAYVAIEHLGERFSALITGVQPFGLFAAIDAPFVEGMVPAGALSDDDWEIDEYGAMLRGVNSGRIYMIGDRIEVEIASVNIARRQIELRPVLPEGAEVERPALRPKEKRRHPWKPRERDRSRTPRSKGPGRKPRGDRSGRSGRKRR